MSSHRFSSKVTSQVNGFYTMLDLLPMDEWRKWWDKPATLENYLAVREIVFPGADLPEDLRSAYRSGLITMDEAKRLADQQEDCTCTPDLPDGRTGKVCPECKPNDEIPF